MTRALKSVPGVRNVAVNFEAKQATVEADGPCDNEKMLAALAADGYKGSVIQ